jgi:hypothetical protein
MLQAIHFSKLIVIRCLHEIPPLYVTKVKKFAQNKEIITQNDKIALQISEILPHKERRIFRNVYPAGIISAPSGE